VKRVRIKSIQRVNRQDATTKRAEMKSLTRLRTIRGRRFLFRVEDSDRPSDYMKYEDIRNRIWQDPDDRMPGGRNMLCENFLHDGGSLFIGVFAEAKRGVFKEDGDHLVGFCYGFTGVDDKAVGFKKPMNLRFYSQYTGVREDFRGYDLGILLKEFQREKVLDILGIGEITCTFDPLSSVNAYRNIHSFGMRVLGYKESVYGGFGGLFNRADVPLDRFYVTWDLRKSRPKRAGRAGFVSGIEHHVVRTEAVEVSGKNGTAILEVIREVRPALDKEFLAVDIPVDFYRMLNETVVEDPGIRRIPLDWRLKTRRIFLGLFKNGYQVIDFRRAEGRARRNFYVLKREGRKGEKR